MRTPFNHGVWSQFCLDASLEEEDEVEEEEGEGDRAGPSASTSRAVCVLLQRRYLVATLPSCFSQS